MISFYYYLFIFISWNKGPFIDAPGVEFSHFLKWGGGDLLVHESSRMERVAKRHGRPWQWLGDHACWWRNREGELRIRQWRLESVRGKRGRGIFFWEAFFCVSLERKLDGREEERDVELSIFPERAWNRAWSQASFRLRGSFPGTTSIVYYLLIDSHF